MQFEIAWSKIQTVNIMYKILIFLASLIYLTSASTSCIQLDTLTDQQLWGLIIQTPFQKLFNIIVGSLSVVVLIITLASWKLYPAFSIPADIMFAIGVCQLIENTSIVASSSYFADYESEPMPTNFSQSCTAIGIFYVIGNFGSLIYNLLFCLVLSFSIRRTLKGSMFNQKRYHIMALIIVTAAVLGLSFSSSIGRGIGGLCGYRIAGRQSIAKFIVQLLIIAGCITSMILFKSKIPKNSYFQKVSMFGYYYYYIGIFSLTQIINTVAYMIGNIACRTGSEYTSNIIRISLIFGNSFSLILSFVLFFLRFSHPILKIKLRKLFDKNYDSSVQDSKFNPDEDPWLGCLLQSIKGSQIISFISGILISFAEHEYKIPEKSTSNTQLLYHKNYVAYLNEDITDEYILRRINNRESNLVRQKLQGLRALDYEVTIYSIGLFAKLISEEVSINIFKSFNINQNIPLIKKSSNINGGKSGQFFFKTFDHRFIIKTIRQDEALIYLSKIYEFYTYFQNNPNTLLSKILGLYKFQRKDVNEQSIYLIIMKNLSPVSSEFFERTYDIKGSEFNRSTLQQKNVRDPDKLRKLTLKDIDFKKLEGKVSISSYYTDSLKKQLKKDAEFLGSMEVIDYSVLIVKRKGPRTPGNPNNQFPSTRQDGIIYNIGIIDYLESWTFRRKAERAFKMMITRKKVTVNSPTAYQKRFTENLDQIF